MPVPRRQGLTRRVFFTAALAAVLSLLKGDTIPPKNYFDYYLGSLTSGYAFNFVSWEITNLAAKLKTSLVDRDYSYLTPDRQQQMVDGYFATADLMDRLSQEIERLHADPGAAEPGRLALLEGKLAAARQRLDGFAAAAEAVLDGQVTTILAEEGIGAGLVGVFPPVSTKFEPPPLLLVVSPREKIEIKTGVQMRPNLELNQIESLEAGADALGVSSLVVNIGGIATYPGMIMQTGARDWAVRTIAHEWLHDYLFLRPLGWSYGQSHEIIAINETVADIASAEIGNLALQRYYGVPLPPAEGEPEEEQPPAPGKEPAFNYNKEMRLTRLTADALLAQGQIAQAEQYMEERRRFFLSKGYVIRKLNQAYFAFHGSYADSPASVDPIGQDLRTLRRRTATLKEFISLTSHLTSYEELKKLIAK